MYSGVNLNAFNLPSSDRVATDDSFARLGRLLLRGGQLI